MARRTRTDRTALRGTALRGTALRGTALRGTALRAAVLRAAVFTVALLLLGGCTDGLRGLVDDLLGEEPPAETAQSDDGDALDVTLGHGDCESVGYACTWDEVAPERFAAAARLAAELSALDGWDRDALTARLAEQPDVVAAAVGDVALWFRLEGARPLWVFDERARVPPADDVAAAAPVELVAASYAPPDRGTSPPVTSTPAAVVGDDPAQKSALLIAPYTFETDTTNIVWATDDIAEVLSQTRGYEGRVDVVQNRTQGERAVGPEHFENWDSYDVVYVATHGLQVCEDAAPDDAAAGALGLDDPSSEDDQETDGSAETTGGCWTALSLGESTITIDPDTVDTQLADILDDLGYGDARNVTLAISGDRAVPVIDGRELAAHYAGGLQDTLVYITACQSARAGDLTAGLSGERSVFLGWSDTAFSGHARDASVRFFTEAADRGVTSGDAYGAVVDADLHRSQGTHRGRQIDAQLVHAAPGTDLRIREVIELQDPQTGDPLVDGDPARLSADELGPTLPVQVEVDGVLPGQAGEFEVDIIVNGVGVAERWPLDARGTQVDEETWRITDEVGLPGDIAAANSLKVDTRVALPEGGTSQHVVALAPERYELRFEAELGAGAGAGIGLTERLTGSILLRFDADVGSWVGDAPPDWATYTLRSDLCPWGTRELSTTSDVGIPRAVIGADGGSVELDLRWVEQRGGPEVACGSGGSLRTFSEHEVAVTALVLAEAGVGAQPQALFEFVAPDTVRFRDWEPGTEAGSFVFERRAGGGMNARFRMELVPG